MGQITVYVGEQRDGFTYRLDPRSRDEVRKRFPDSRPASSIFVSYDTKSDVEQRYGSLWLNIVEMLTGLEEEQIHQLDEFVFIDPKSGKMLFRTSPQNV